MEFTEFDSNKFGLSKSKTKEKTKELEIDEYIPHHNNYLQEIKSSLNETADEILKEIESIVVNTSHQEIYSNQDIDIPFEHFDNPHRSKTQEFYFSSKRKFSKINNNELTLSYNQNHLRRKSSLSQNFSFIKV